MAEGIARRAESCSYRGAIDIWRFEGDKFVEHWDELNTLDVFQQLGAIPATRTAVDVEPTRVVSGHQRLLVPRDRLIHISDRFTLT